MEYYSAIKDEIMSFAKKWMELSEISQAQRAEYCMFFAHLWNLNIK
jgi:hypothetical protein